MLVSDIPTSATVVAPGAVWSDAFSQNKYYVDPNDATLATTRSWTPAELSTFNQQQASLGTNKATLQTSLSTSITTLKADIGPKQSLITVGNPDPTLVPGPTSLNAILADTNANINASPAKYVTFLTKVLRDLSRAQIAGAKIDLNQVSDTDLGQ